MRFDVNRLSVLAGLPAQKSRNLNEASNRSLHDDPALAGEAEYRYGKNQLAEEAHGDKVAKEGHGGLSHSMEEEQLPEEALPEDYTEEGYKMEEGETVYEVDASELKEELMRLRRMSRQNKTQKLQEAQLKRIIEQEVQNVFKDLEEGKLDLNITGDWVYGSNKPRNSRRGRIARGFKSIGFK
jgi:hypothetical protein